MERGYFKVWRKIKDSQSYNRSALHRAILLTIFVDANWKGGFFCGRQVAPGQVATSVKGLAEELREPRSNVMRALRDIEKDGVIKIENVGNKWTMITLVNWSVYQPQDEKSGQPVVNHRSTSGQPVDTIKEGKKERIEESSLREDVGTKVPPCPHQQILDMYHELLPVLPRMKVWDKARKGNLGARWRERWEARAFSTQEEGLDYFRRMFTYIGRDCHFLMGRVIDRDGKPFFASLDWIVLPKNFAKVLECKYSRREAA